jgi:hypothetical protein
MPHLGSDSFRYLVDAGRLLPNARFNVLHQLPDFERDSSATTAKPIPASPARAASTAAFKARPGVEHGRLLDSAFMTGGIKQSPN